MTYTIAHFSDTHVLSLKDARFEDFLNKRFTGAVNLVLNRGRHYRTEVFEAVLDAITECAPDHVVCTGDLVNLALQAEFDKVKELLAQHFEPAKLTIVPGNHDYYVKQAMELGHFEQTFAQYIPKTSNGKTYPFVRDLGDVVLVGLCSAIEQPVFFAGGRIGDEQLEEMSRLLSLPEYQDKFKIVLVHHPLLPDPERRMEFTRQLADAESLIHTFWMLGDDAPQMVLNGHNHRYRRCVLPGTEIVNVQAASASRFGGHHPAEFNLYQITGQSLSRIERRIFDSDHFKRVVAYEGIEVEEGT